MRVNVTEKLNKKGKYRILMQKELENKMGNWDELGLAIFYLPRAQSDNIVLRGHGESGQSHTGPIILLGMPGDRISALCSPTNMEKCKRQKKKRLVQLHSTDHCPGGACSSLPISLPPLSSSSLLHIVPSPWQCGSVHTPALCPLYSSPRGQPTALATQLALPLLLSRNPTIRARSR